MAIQKLNKYISMSDSPSNGTGDIYIYGDIASMDWWDSDVTPTKIKETLDNINNIKQLNIHINSYGGEVFAGNAIVNIFDNFKKKNKCQAHVYIEGIAASMSSGIAMVGDKVYMSANSLFMLHKPLSMIVGNANDMQKEIEVLDKVEETLVSNYMRKFNGTEEELRQMLSDETWLTSDEAQRYGFVDEITESTQMVASAKGVKVKDTEFENSKVVNLLKEKYANKIEEKEVNNMKFVYDEKLKEFGVEENLCKDLNIAVDKVFEIANAVKEYTISNIPQNEDKFQLVVDSLETDEKITVENLISYAKLGMNPVVDKVMQEKADFYDKIFEEEKEKAIKNAFKAQGDLYNESVTRKMLNALSYEEVVEQNNIWEQQAKERLNAGIRVSIPEKEIETFNNKEKELFNENDYKFN